MGQSLPDRAGHPSRGSRIAIALVLVIFIIGAAIAWVAGPRMFADPELWGIERTRAANFARSARGEPLPGTPDLAALDTRLAAAGLALGAPVLIRIFKREFELELWLARDDRFVKFATYPICRWSGRLGPKLTTGDRQAPEGFYTVAADQMNPNSRWHRSFNLGFPNPFDQAHGRSGSALMVHGGCSSAGCYAMTNPVIDELWRFTTAALAGRQKRFQVQVYPFRLTDATLAAHAASPHAAFWSELKQGADLFEATGLPPLVTACRGSYQFAPGTSTNLTPALAADCSPRMSAVGRAKKAL